MTIKMLRFFACLAGCFCLTRPALAWNAEGHMIVAQIAYNHLDPAVKAQCTNLIAVAVYHSSSINSNFVTAGPWADDIKSYTTNYDDSHYIDIGLSLDGYPTNQVANDESNVVAAINQCIATLQDSSQSQSNQAVALRFLIHFVGDIQQPLHATTGVSSNMHTGDLGGNSFLINDGSITKLHALWDDGGGFLTDSITRPLTPTSQATLNSKAAICETAYPYSFSVGSIPDPMSWALESRLLASNTAYVGISSNTTPSVAYTNAAQNTTIQRMAIGGQRLAKLLNTIFVTNAPVLNASAFVDPNFNFSWTSISGRTYRVQMKQQMTDTNWTDLVDITATGGLTTFTTNSASSPQLFFRAIVVN